MAQLTCPQCGSPISAEQINIQKTLAVCPACATVFDFSATVSDPAPIPAATHKRKRRKVKQPEHITIQPNATGLDLVYKWGIKSESQSTLFWMGLWAVIAIAISIVFPLLSGEAIFSGDSPFWLGTLFVGGFPFYYFLCLFTNSTRFLLDEDQLQVRTTPLWFWGAGHATVDTPDVEAVYWELAEDADEDDENYTVYARLRDGERKKLLEGILKLDAEFIAQEMNSALYELENGDYAHLTEGEDMEDESEASHPAARERKA